MSDDQLLAAILDQVPQRLRHVSGAVLYSGREAWTGTADLYLMGLNPGGDPALETETVAAQVHRVLRIEDANYSSYRDDSWGNGEFRRGEHRMQRNVLHLLETLGLDPGLVPSSNLVFARSRSWGDLPRKNQRAWAEACWPFHQAMIERLRVRVVLCFGRPAGDLVRAMMGAHEEIDCFIESNNRGWASRAYRGSEDVIVVQATHPSRAVWLNPSSDVTPLIERALHAAT